jgi:hypothetical protein
VGGLWTGDESWIIWVNPLTWAWMTIEEELPLRVPQTIKATQSMLRVFFNPKEFVPTNLLPRAMSVAAEYSIEPFIISLANRHAQQRGNIARRKRHLPFDNFKCHAARHVRE